MERSWGEDIEFISGNQVINTYAANGQKLRTKYYTAIFPVVGPILDLEDTIEVLNSTSDATVLSSPAKASAKTIPDYISLKRTILRLDDYFGNILYENGTAEDAAHHPITKVLTPEGYVDYATAGKPYCYYRKDHLGSIREVDTYQGGPTVVQKTQYYPSGTPFAESFGAGEQPYKFTGKEMITMHGLNWQDFGARWLDNARLQFTSVDPLAEDDPSVSPYVYCRDNPINRIDPDGMKDIPLPEVVVVAPKPKNTVIETHAITIPLSLPMVYSMSFAERILPVFFILNRIGSDTNRYDASSKNSPHANQKAKEAAEQEYNEVEQEYDNLKSKPNKTPDDKNKLEKLKRSLKRLKDKMDFKGENHSRNAKGNR